MDISSSMKTETRLRGTATSALLSLVALFGPACGGDGAKDNEPYGDAAASSTDAASVDGASATQLHDGGETVANVGMDGGVTVDVGNDVSLVDGGAGSTPNVDASGAGLDGSTWPGIDAASACGEPVMPADCTIPAGASLPTELRCTGLYQDWSTRTLACGVTSYVPAHHLWADGAGKQRYVWLPPGATIDASDPDNFVYPVGTRFWKEFLVGPEGHQQPGETRYLLKAADGWHYTSYVWSNDGTTAIQTNDGVADLFSTGHTVPTQGQCRICHQGRPDFVLGWDFALLGPGATGVTARTLAAAGRLTGYDPAMLDLKIPGDAVEQSALGYLHVNCGVTCHNTTGKGIAERSGLFMRLEAAKMASVMATDVATTGINRLSSADAYYGSLTTPAGGDFYDLRPQDPSRSFVVARMSDRDSTAAMPPLGTHKVDVQGVAAVTAWINAMTPERGYPAPAP
jgi:hypothetical protein